MQPKILVTSAAGNVGSATVRELCARGVRPRIFVHSTIRLPSDLDDLDVVAGDVGDPAVVATAVQNVDAVLVIAADGPAKVSHETAIIDAAAHAGVAHIVKLSAMHADPGSASPCFAWHGQIEQRLTEVTVPHTILRPAFFMENMLMVAGSVRADSEIHGPTAGQPVAMIAVDDVAACAAAVLTGPAPTSGRSVWELTGPRAVTFAQVADAIAAAIGRGVSYTELTPEQAQPRFEADKPEWLATHLSGVFGVIRQGGFAHVTGDCQRLLGHPPGGIEEFARRYAPAFAGPVTP